MAHLNVWFILLLLATADRGRYRRRNGRRRGGGMGTVQGSSTEGVTSPDDPESDAEVGNATCRNKLPSELIIFFSLCFLLVNHTRIYELISSNAIDLDPFEFPLHLNGSYSRVAAIRTDVCPGNVTSCFHGFSISMWLLANDTSVTDEGVYYLSSGAQRTESCGFYFRLDSVNSDPNGSRVGVFDIAVATADTLWKVRYQARMSVKSHVMMSWGPDVGLDVYIDGICAGNPDTDEGYQRYPLTNCSDDPFQDLYIGGRNDLASGGFAVADVGELIIWDAWKNPIDVYNLEKEA
ncbi:uncharacterized protein LOC119735053 [Patiria miniata]|uniref:Uncharacterized protein n=1 Tax=Patiria miniata TaxID=46514 RepID=A0A914AM53_PATMI|nr:uncharacterized protein LOC119735053 [Patiria miniata]